MIKKILRFTLNEHGVTTIKTIGKPIFLHVGADKDYYPSVWVEAIPIEEDPDLFPVWQTAYHIVHTGEEPPYWEDTYPYRRKDATYRGTVHLASNQRILHVYEWE